MKYLPWIVAALSAGFGIYQTLKLAKMEKQIGALAANGASGAYNHPSNFVEMTPEQQANFVNGVLAANMPRVG